MSASEIEITAAEWLRRSEEPEWSVADQAALDAWLGESMAHKAAYWRLEHGWRMADRIRALGPSTGPAPRTAHRWPAWRYGALAASLCAVILSASLLRLERPRAAPAAVARFDTRVGGHSVVPLPDGSRIELNTGTRLRTNISERGREVWLDRGEAYFEVAHREGLTFVVHAGPRTVTVLGTKFSVRRDGDIVHVAVVEGRVRIDDSARDAPAASAIVTRGDVALAQGDSTLVTTRSIERVEGDLAWREGRLAFDRTTLAAAAAEFNRYNRVQIAVTDPAVASIRIGGTFQAANVEAFVRLLQEAYGLKVQRNGDRITISG